MCGIDGGGAQDDSATSCMNSDGARHIFSQFEIVGMPRMIQFLLDFEFCVFLENLGF